MGLAKKSIVYQLKKDPERRAAHAPSQERATGAGKTSSHAHREWTTTLSRRTGRMGSRTHRSPAAIPRRIDGFLPGRMESRTHRSPAAVPRRIDGFLPGRMESRTHRSPAAVPRGIDGFLPGRMESRTHRSPAAVPRRIDRFLPGRTNIRRIRPPMASSRGMGRLQGRTLGSTPIHHINRSGAEDQE